MSLSYFASCLRDRDDLPGPLCLSPTFHDDSKPALTDDDDIVLSERHSDIGPDECGTCVRSGGACEQHVGERG